MIDIDILQYIKNYGTFEVKIKSFDELYLPSDDVISYYAINGPQIEISQNKYIKITQNILGVKQLGIYVDDEYLASVEYDDSEDWVLDLSEFEISEGRHRINLKGMDEGLNDNYSNTVYFYGGIVPIYGVSGLALSNVTLTRTDDSELLTYNINTETGEVSSDFDNVFPWKDTEIVEEEAGKFILFPTMYFRVGTNSSNNITDIAVSPAPHEEGNWYEVSPFMYGCYAASVVDGKMKSLSGAVPTTALTRANFRSYAQKTGELYHQLDLYHYIVLNFLFWIEFATKNTRNIMTGKYTGSGTLKGTTKLKTGGTDHLINPSGYNLETTQMRYHYIEDFVGNVYQFIDGIYCTSTSSSNYATADPEKFSDSSTGMSQLSFKNPSSNYSYPTTTTIGWDPNNPFLVMPTGAVNNSSYNTYFCSRNANLGSYVLYCGGAYSTSLVNTGTFALTRCSTTQTYDNVGARLIKRIE